MYTYFMSQYLYYSLVKLAVVQRRHCLPINARIPGQRDLNRSQYDNILNLRRYDAVKSKLLFIVQQK